MFVKKTYAHLDHVFNQKYSKNSNTMKYYKL